MKANEVAEERYFKIPKAFFLTEKYKDMSLEAKVIYGFLKDRSNLSLKNNWIDAEGSIYLIYTRKNIQEMLCLSDKTVTKAFKQLIDYELIEEERQGLNKPNLIYVCHIDFKNIEEMRIRNFYDSSIGENTNQESDNIRRNDTDLNYTHLNIEGEEVWEGLSKDKTKSIPYYDFLLLDIKNYKSNNKHDIVEFIIYYYGKYQEHLNKEHYRYSKLQLKEIYSKIDDIFELGVCNEETGDYYAVNLDCLKDMTDKHFITEYKNINWTLLSFLNNKVMINRYWEVC